MAQENINKEETPAEHRESMVDVLNKAIEIFCMHSERTFEEIMRHLLLPLSDVMGMERIIVDRQHDNEDIGSLRRSYRWKRTAAGIVKENAINFHEHTLLQEWPEIYRPGDCVMRSISETQGDEKAFLNRYGLKSVVIIPIFTHSAFWGNVVFESSRNEHTIAEDNIDIVKSYARLCANTIIRHEMELEFEKQNKVTKEIAKMQSNIQRLQSESEKIFLDSLTGIYNRRFFDQNLNRVIKTLSRSEGVLSLMMIDIDNFKQYNDMYGHSAGDACLKSVAGILAGCTAREDDFVARYGGDEFAVVLPNTDEDGACMIAEKLIDSIRSFELQYSKNGAPRKLTISVGVTTGKVKSRQRIDDFILRADELLYKSKQDGRDRYTFGRLG